jgi:hypothetical protein
MTTKNYVIRAVRVFVAALTALLFALLLAGCSPQAAGESGQLQRLVAQCPDGPVDVDGSGSQGGARISSQALEVVTDQGTWAAACACG